jgi:hypothetical protein
VVGASGNTEFSMPRKGSKAELAAIARAFRRLHPHRHALACAKNASKTRGLPFNLIEEHVKKVFEPGVCVYCTRRVVFGTSRTSPSYERRLAGSLDKIVPELGYVIGNVALACMSCNQRKSDMSPDFLRALAERIEQVALEYGRRSR